MSDQRHIDEGEELVNGKLHLRSAAQLTPKQLKSACDHLRKVRFDSAAGALIQAPGAELFAALQGRRRAGLLYLHRCAVTVIAGAAGNPMIATSFSYQFPQLLGFVAQSDVRIARITASRSRSRLAASADLYAVASDEREAQSWSDAGFEEVPQRAVKHQCVDLVTLLSSGSLHRWYFMEDAEVARQHELKLRNDNKVREIIDKYRRSGLVTAADKAEWRRIAGKLSIGDLGSIEVSYDRASIPAGEPSITAEEAAKLLE